MALTAGQQRCVDTLDAPIAVSAGAGSGKTYTLTRRIVHALESGYLKSIDEVLAITFTTKAAGEIKSRVKSALRATGMADEALKVDGAWISTIHGMCARIIRAHALELGVLPSFEVASETLVAQLLDQALDETLGGSEDLVSQDSRYDALFTQFSVRSKSLGSSSSVEGMVRSIVVAASASPDGMASVHGSPSAQSPVVLVQQLVDAASLALDLASGVKPGKTRDKYVAECTAALECAHVWLSGGSHDFDSALQLANTFPFPGKNFGKGSAYGDQVGALQEAHLTCVAQLRQGYCAPLERDLLELSSQVYERFCELKAASGVLDNNDLLSFAARALDGFPNIASEYADRFKLVMIDEFQDTDQLQVAMIKRLAGAGFTRMCTVGDAQQSIYRFRGADVSVYNRHLADVEATNPQGLIELADNFRSHESVLSFCDSIFDQPQVFGGSYMPLKPARDEAAVRRPYKGSAPRIRVQLTARPYKGVDAGYARGEAATRIARAFAQLHQEGHALSDMVILLGGMTNAGLYAQALRNEGLACVISGGSTFANAPEVQLMLRLAQTIANPCWSAAAFEVLSSPLFALSADDLLELSTGFNEIYEVPARRSIVLGLREMIARCSAGEKLSPALTHLVSVFERIEAQVHVLPLSSIMQDVLVQSGWLSRVQQLGPEGLARAANAYKAIRMVSDIEQEGGLGISSVATRFAAALELSKESPGALSSNQGDFIRIMTVHASKGLEFPIVALAEMRNDMSRSAALQMASLFGQTYVSLDGGSFIRQLCDDSPSGLVAKSAAMLSFGDADQEELMSFIIHADNPALYRAALHAYEARGEAEESSRLLYVALTRAKEALIVSMNSRVSKSDPSGLSKSVFGDVQSALVGADAVFETGRTTYVCGDHTAVEVERIDLQDGEDAHEDEESGCLNNSASESTSESANIVPVFDVPEVNAFEYSLDALYRPARGCVFSYSSLHELSGAEQAASEDYSIAEVDVSSQVPSGEVASTMFDEEDETAWSAIAHLAKDLDYATNLGTAFHRLAQYAVCMRQGNDALVKPDEVRIKAMAQQMKLDAAQMCRLEHALNCWFDSDVCARVGSYAHVLAEVPFFACMEGAGTAGDSQMPYLEGEIDLLAYDDSLANPKAFLVDYKTGGSQDESPEHLVEKHRLQSICYAYALMSAGFSEVEAHFVRVEQQTPSGQPQVVSYAYSLGDLAELKEAILSLR